MNNQLFVIVMLCTISMFSFRVYGEESLHLDIFEEVSHNSDNSLVNNLQTNEFLSAFSTFITNFIGLLSCQAPQNNAVMLDQLLISLIKMTVLLIKNDIYSVENTDALLRTISPHLKNEMASLMSKESRSIIITRKKHTKPHDKNKIAQKDKKEVAQILGFASAAMQNFFGIVKDPENRENVISGLMGMLASVIGAGKVIMKRNNITIEHDTETIVAKVAFIDQPFKEEILVAFTQTRSGVERIG